MKTVKKIPAPGIAAAAVLVFIMTAAVYTADYITPSGDLNYDSLTASSTLKDRYNRYDVSHLMDGTWASWCEGLDGDGAGAKITLKYIWTQNVAIERFYVKNGFGLDSWFRLNNRVKELRITGNKTGSATVTLDDTPKPQEVTLDKPVTGYQFTFEIVSVYQGKKFQDTCISEISFEPIEIQDQKKMPDFDELTFMLPTGNYSGRMITLRKNGTVSGEHMLGHQCSTPIISGTWNLREGKVYINYTWGDPVNCGDMAAEIKYEKRRASIVLVRFGLDGIIDDEGNRAKEIKIK